MKWSYTADAVAVKLSQQIGNEVQTCENLLMLKMFDTLPLCVTKPMRVFTIHSQWLDSKLNCA